MYGMNVFRILGDVSHTLSKCILIFAIHRNKSAEGVSLITQGLYALVFCTRYLDLFRNPPLRNVWNFVLKIFYILSSFYILVIMLRIYARTREREKAWKMGGWCLGGSMVLAPIVTLIFRHGDERTPLEFFWVFSIVLESVCVLPQLLLLRQTTVPTVIDSFYLVALGAYRAFYILNWIEREIETDDKRYGPDAVSVIFGVVQTALYLDFAWVYYTRQRVKLRSGGLVDSDDLRKSWLLSRIFGKHVETDEDEESRPALGDEEERGRPPPRRNGGSKWGKKGISVSADHDVIDSENERQRDAEADIDAPDAQMRDPDELAMILEDEDESEDDGVLPTHTDGNGNATGIKGGEEWRQGSK